MPRSSPSGGRRRRRSATSPPSRPTSTIYGEWGFRDSVNVQTGAVSDAYLSLDQGIIMAAIGNELDGDLLRDAFATKAFTKVLRPIVAMETVRCRAAGAGADRRPPVTGDRIAAADPAAAPAVADERPDGLDPTAAAGHAARIAWFATLGRTGGTRPGRPGGRPPAAVARDRRARPRPGDRQLVAGRAGRRLSRPPRRRPGRAVRGHRPGWRGRARRSPRAVPRHDRRRTSRRRGTRWPASRTSRRIGRSRPPPCRPWRWRTTAGSPWRSTPRTCAASSSGRGAR